MIASGVEIDRSRSKPRTLTIDARKFFSSVGRAVVKLGAGAYTDAASEIPEIATALGLSVSLEDRATALVVGLTCPG